MGGRRDRDQIGRQIEAARGQFARDRREAARIAAGVEVAQIEGDVIDVRRAPSALDAAGDNVARRQLGQRVQRRA